jgi:uncharacterized membrane protein
MAACGTGFSDSDRNVVPGSAGPSVPAGTSGMLSVSGEDLSFQPCGAASPVRVLDATGQRLAALVAELGGGRGSIHAHLVLEDGTARELRVAAPESGSCEGLLPPGEMQARGNEPFWNVTVDGSVAVWRSPDEPDGVEYRNGSWTAAGTTWRFQAMREVAGGTESLVVDFREAVCADSMSGARYPYSTFAARGITQYEGCGLEGQAAAVARPAR